MTVELRDLTPGMRFEFADEKRTNHKGEWMVIDYQNGDAIWCVSLVTGKLLGFFGNDVVKTTLGEKADGP
jgi:hypothetical protein